MKRKNKMVALLPLTREQCQLALKWRNQCRLTLRTPYYLTGEMQDKFYEDVICNRNTPHRYYAIIDNDKFIGMGGLTNIEWENGVAEISLIFDPLERNHGHGTEAVGLLLKEAFDNMRLATVFAECYMCNQAISFWKRLADGYVILHRRKFWRGQFWDSIYCTFTKKE